MSLNKNMPSDFHVWAWVVGDGPGLLHDGSVPIFPFMGTEGNWALEASGETFCSLTFPVTQGSGKQNQEWSEFMAEPPPPSESSHLIT